MIHKTFTNINEIEMYVGTLGVMSIINSISKQIRDSNKVLPKPLACGATYIVVRETDSYSKPTGMDLMAVCSFEYTEDKQIDIELHGGFLFDSDTLPDELLDIHNRMQEAASTENMNSVFFDRGKSPKVNRVEEITKPTQLL